MFETNVVGEMFDIYILLFILCNLILYIYTVCRSNRIVYLNDSFFELIKRACGEKRKRLNISAAQY